MATGVRGRLRPPDRAPCLRHSVGTDRSRSSSLASAKSRIRADPPSSVTGVACRPGSRTSPGATVTVRPAENQSGGDPVLAVRLQEIRSAHLVSVRTVAGRWEQGIRGLLGVTGGRPQLRYRSSRRLQHSLVLILPKDHVLVGRNWVQNGCDWGRLTRPSGPHDGLPTRPRSWYKVTWVSDKVP
jgi:hypothetical protein